MAGSATFAFSPSGSYSKASSRNGDGLSMLVTHNHHLDIGTLAVVHKSDRGHIDRVGANATLFHKAPSQNNGEVAVLSQHNGTRHGLGSDLDRPFAEVGDAVKTVRAWRGVLGDEAVVERKAAADVNMTVARLEHHRHVLNRADAALEQTNTKLRVELLEGDLVRRNGGDGGIGLARLGSVRRDRVSVGRLGTWELGNDRLAVAWSDIRLARRRVHDGVSTTGGDSASFAVVISRRNKRSRHAVDADGTALSSTSGAVYEGRLVHDGDVWSVVCAVSRVRIGALRWDFRGFEENYSVHNKETRRRVDD